MEKVTTDNIFEDLGFSPDEAALLKRKTLLLLELETIVKQNRFNLTQAAKRFGVRNAVIKELKSNNIDFFTIDLLIQMLDHAGKDVQMIVTDKKHIRAA
jgi:predicted XRE-type DNA-binding protein